MTIENFINNNEINARNIGSVPNKCLVKIFRKYRYIDIAEYWYDNPDDENQCTWIDMEGFYYGWLWLGYKHKKERRNKLINLAMSLHNNEEVYSYTDDGTKHYLWQAGDEIVDIGLSNELSCLVKENKV